MALGVSQKYACSRDATPCTDATAATCSAHDVSARCDSEGPLPEGPWCN